MNNKYVIKAEKDGKKVRTDSMEMSLLQAKVMAKKLEEQGYSKIKIVGAEKL
jgi:hypothetical protein